MKIISFISALIITFSLSTSTSIPEKEKAYPKAEVSFSDFKEMANEVEEIRSKRLLSLETFLEYSKDPNTIILDARSRDKFENIHIKGAKHLAFTDFTQEALEALIPDRNTRILIYCNNNFEGEPINFASKFFNPNVTAVLNDGRSLSPSPVLNPKPKKAPTPQSTPNPKPKKRSMALNIPTYVNLHGYGYTNIYELDEMVNVNDPRIEMTRKM